MLTTIIAESVFIGNEMLHNVPVTFSENEIVALDTVPNSTEHRFPGLLVPGFIDTQVNGGGGYLFNTDTSLDTLEYMVQAHAQFGTTSLLPTLITSDVNKIAVAADVISEAVSQSMPGVLGIHFEGPHISQPKRGIHDSGCIREISQQEMDIYCRDDLGIKLLTLAPEQVSMEQIRTLVEHNVIISIGHTNATYALTNQAIAAGATGFTHLFNAMSALESREPNSVGAALLNDNCYCGIILDGHHVHPATAKLAYQIKQEQKLLLVTDAMSTVGSKQTNFTFNENNIVRVADKLTNQNGQLAGSALNMISAVNNAQTMLGASLTSALSMASSTPAEFLGIQAHYGSLNIGAKPNFTLLNSEQKNAVVTHTWINGKLI